MSASERFDLAIVGGGPAGYVGAFFAAQRGLRTALVEKKYLGGTCLNVGCIPSKALIHCVEMLDTAKAGRRFGIDFGDVQPDLDKVRAYRDRVVKQLVGGVEGLLEKRQVAVFRGTGLLEAPDRIRVEGLEGAQTLEADQVLLCTGSEPVCLPMCDLSDELIITSDSAVHLPGPPESLAIIGGGAIGLEFAYIYSGFGTKVTVVEMLPRILPTEDPEASAVVARAFQKRGIKIVTGARVQEIEPSDTGKRLVYECDGECEELQAHMVLVAVGRRAATDGLGLEEIGVSLDRGRIQTDEHYMTSVENVYAAGDCLRGVGLAHQASHEAVVAIENMLGHESHVCVDCIPAGIYSHPEVASVGLREHEAREQGQDIRVGKFPWSALGRATVVAEREGFIKLIADAATGRMMGGTIVGPLATELIAEIALAVQHGLTMQDVADTIHGHPTFNEGVGEAAFAGLGLPLHFEP